MTSYVSEDYNRVLLIKCENIRIYFDVFVGVLMIYFPQTVKTYYLEVLVNFVAFKTAKTKKFSLIVRKTRSATRKLPANDIIVFSNYPATLTQTKIAFFYFRKLFCVWYFLIK